MYTRKNENLLWQSDRNELYIKTTVIAYQDFKIINYFGRKNGKSVKVKIHNYISPVLFSLKIRIEWPTLTSFVKIRCSIQKLYANQHFGGLLKMNILFCLSACHIVNSYQNVI